jgi:putative sigma-54 modulation protein
MEMQVRNAEGNLTDQDREYASKKLGKLNRYFHKAHKVEMVHREERHLHIVEVTVFADHFTLRGQEKDESIRAAIDNVSEKLETRLRRLKRKLVNSHRRRSTPIPQALDEHLAAPVDEPEETIEKYEHFSPKPMSVEEAVLQLELIDRQFLTFCNQDNGQVEVVFRTKKGGFGLVTRPV